MGYPCQALALLPLRYNEYLPMLSRAYEHCKLIGIDFDKHIDSFFSSEYGLEFKKVILEEDDKERICERLKSFVQNLEALNESPKDWLGDYSLALGFYDADKAEEAKAFAKRKERYLKIYEQYLRNS